MTESETMLAVLREFTNLFTPMWFWKMDRMFNVISSDCPHESLYRSLFLRDGRREAIESHMASSTKPVCFTVSSMLSWVMAFERAEKEIIGIYVMGPFFVGYNDPENYSDYLASMALSDEAGEILRSGLKQLPVMNSATMVQNAVLLNYCVQGERLSVGDVVTYASQPRRLHGKVEVNQFEKSSGRWSMEQELLDKVRKGDVSAPNVLSAAGNAHMISAFGSGKSILSLRQNVHQLLTLISRAAVDGGLPQRTSFSLCTEYRNRLERCKSAGEIAMVSNEMVRDYASRVHNMKKFSRCSPPIRLCCEYIDTHPEEKVTLEDLAQKAGYSSYHLCRKFQQEMGCSVIDYIHKSKIERSKYLLTHTALTLEQISADLGFNSRSYFTAVFKKQEGVSPTQYRRQKAKI